MITREDIASPRIGDEVKNPLSLSIKRNFTTPGGTFATEHHTFDAFAALSFDMPLPALRLVMGMNRAIEF